MQVIYGSPEYTLQRIPYNKKYYKSVLHYMHSLQESTGKQLIITPCLKPSYSFICDILNSPFFMHVQLNLCMNSKLAIHDACISYAWIHVYLSCIFPTDACQALLENFSHCHILSVFSSLPVIST